MAGGVKGSPLAAGQKEGNGLKYSIWIEIYLEALEHNLKQLEEHCSVPVLPVLKADAYGHGAPGTASFLKSKGYSSFAVSTVEEALSILAFTKASILLLAPPPPQQLPLICKYGLICSASSPQLILNLADCARRLRKTVDVQLKVDTGLGRLGASPAEAEEIASLIKKTPYLKLKGAFTHFAAAFSDPEFTRKQLRRLLQLRQKLLARGWQGLTWHAANSAAFLTFPASHLDLVRIGTLLYGQSPLPLDSSWRAEPTWACKTRLIQTRCLNRGQTIGYGKAYRAPKRIKVGVVPVGYAHGLEVEPQTGLGRLVKQSLAKSLRPKYSPIFYGSVPLPILGRIGMNLCCVDLSSAPALSPGSELTVVMRRTTAAQNIARVYFYDGQIKYIYERGKLLHKAFFD